MGDRGAGGSQSLSQYYSVEGDRGVFKNELRRNVVFASHNFVTDASFNQFDLEQTPFEPRYETVDGPNGVFQKRR